MGLDMYLKKHTYVKNWEHMSANEKTKVVVTKNRKPHPNIKPERVSYIIEDVNDLDLTIDSYNTKLYYL
jgi:hypothetical protein